jgi:hypothetical protein
MVAVEPQKNVFDYLPRRFRDKPQVICLNEAVGERARTQEGRVRRIQLRLWSTE